MRIKELKYNNRDSLIIYMTEEDKNNENLKKRINDYKKSFSTISIFISGKNKIEDVLIKMIERKQKVKIILDLSLFFLFYLVSLNYPNIRK